jgi:translocation and assembly module TamB
MLKLILTAIKWAIKILLILILAFGLIFMIAQTKFGKEGSIGFANYLLSGDQMKIEATGITGVVPFDIKIDHLILKDTSGPWLDVRDLKFRFSPLYLFKGRILIREFMAESILLDRLPNLEKSEKAGSTRPFSLPNFLYHIGLERLSVPRLSLGKDILGKPATFKVGARVTDEEAGLKSILSFNVERTDGVKGSAYVEAEVKGAEPYLTIDAGIDEPETGLLGAVTGLRMPLFVLLKGAGPLKTWNGRFSARAGQLINIDSSVGLQSLEDFHIDVDGTARFLSGETPGIVVGLTGPETSFKIKSRIKEKSQLIIDSADLKSNNTAIALNGKLDLKKLTTEGSLNVDINDVSPLSGLIHTECAGAVSLEGDFKGPVARPSFDGRLQINGPGAASIQAEDFGSEVLVEWQTEKGSSARVLHVSAKGSIKGLHVPALSSLPEKQVSWNLDMTGPNKGEVRIKTLQLAGDVLSAGISGAYDFNKADGSFEALVSGRSLEKYSSLAGMSIPPGIGTETRIRTILSKNSFRFDLSGRISASNLTDDMITKIIYPEIKYSGNVEVSEARALKVSGFRMESRKAVVICSGSYGLNDQMIHGLMNLQSDNINGFAPLINNTIAGSIKVDASVDGTPDLLTLKSEVKAANLVYGQAGIQDISASISLKGNISRSEGAISFVSNHNGYAIKGHSAFKLDNKVGAFNGLLFEGPGFNLNGDGSYDFKNSLAKGELNGDCKDLSVPASLFNQKIQGSANVKISLNTSKTKLAELNLQAKNISGAFGKVDGFDAKLGMSGDSQSPELTLACSLSGYQNKNVRLKKIDINANGAMRDVAFTLKGTGHAGFDMQVETAGHLSISSGDQTLTLDRLQGVYGTVPVNLKQPLHAIRSDKTIELKSADINLSGGTLIVSGKLSDEYVNLDLKAYEIPVSLLQLAGITDLEGAVTGGVTLEGPLKAPDGRLQLALNNLRLRDQQYSKLPPFKVSFISELKSGELHADLSLEGSTGNRFYLQMDTPCVLSFSPASWSFPLDRSIKGRLSGKLDLQNIASLAGLYDQIITGNLDMNFDLKGTLKSPEITGHATIENGSYENLNIGASVKKVKADITAEGSRFVLNNVTGEEGKAGTVAGTGYFDFSPAKDFPYDLSLSVKNVTVIRTNTSILTVRGKPSLTGNIKDHIIKGKLTVERGEFKIPERLPAEITDLQVKEINGPEQQTAEQKQKTKSLMKLDLSVESNGQVFLTGRGLTSEWTGDISLKGSTREPIITGRLSILHGNYNFLGKRFTLTNGLIELDGQYPMSPTMDVTGKAEAAKITAIINITGDVSKPTITLTSEPTLPSDEVLSQLLFEKDIANISPMQAIELASSLNTMLGKGNMDIVGRTRSILGVDQLDVKQTEENSVVESTVTVGKYLSDSFYIEVEKGTGETSGKASVKWDITPNLSLDTEVGEDATTGVGINWRWNY